MKMHNDFFPTEGLHAQHTRPPTIIMLTNQKGKRQKIAVMNASHDILLLEGALKMMDEMILH